jgi:hypothetical protein
MQLVMFAPFEVTFFDEQFMIYFGAEHFRLSSLTITNDTLLWVRKFESLLLNEDIVAKN